MPEDPAFLFVRSFEQVWKLCDGLRPSAQSALSIYGWRRGILV